MNPDTDTSVQDEIRDFIMLTSEPLILKNALNWELLKWDLNKWTTILGEDPLPFRCGKNRPTNEPQFENTTKVRHFTFKDFLEYQATHPDEWLYFDYKYLKEWLIDIPEFEAHVSWTEFGFPELNFADSSIWIGTKGAHTPCHMDTYGCNMVAQVYGRKRWILFPPDENLQPTRVPYEESSIYSNMNLFTPRVDNFKDVKHCRSVVLNPGDVLILPHRWWHYVENLDVAISINTWIQLPVDHEERVNESIVLLLVSQIGKQLSSEQQQFLFNPPNTEDGEIAVAEQEVETLIGLLKKSMQQYRLEKDTIDSMAARSNIKTVPPLTNMHVVERLSEEEFKILLEIQKSKFDSQDGLEVIVVDRDKELELKKVVDVILDCDVINLMKEKLLRIPDLE